MLLFWVSCMLLILEFIYLYQCAIGETVHIRTTRCYYVAHVSFDFQKVSFMTTIPGAKGIQCNLPIDDDSGRCTT